MKDYISVNEVLLAHLLTTEDTNYFIKNSESFIKGTVTIENLLKSYPFLKDIEITSLKKNFQNLRTDLLSRKKVKIYTPITVSTELIANIYPILSKFSKTKIVIEPIQDTSIVAGIKFNYDGKIFDLTLDNINSKRVINK